MWLYFKPRSFFANLWQEKVGEIVPGFKAKTFRFVMPFHTKLSHEQGVPRFQAAAKKAPVGTGLDWLQAGRGRHGLCAGLPRVATPSHYRYTDPEP